MIAIDAPAFPETHVAPTTDAAGWHGKSGMTLRDYFAAAALKGFCANPAIFATNPKNGWALVNSTENDLVEYAYLIADLMLAERAK